MNQASPPPIPPVTSQQGQVKQCRKCRTWIDMKASRCPSCRSRQGMGCLTKLVIVGLVLFVFPPMFALLGYVVTDGANFKAATQPATQTEEPQDNSLPTYEETGRVPGKTIFSVYTKSQNRKELIAIGREYRERYRHEPSVQVRFYDHPQAGKHGVPAVQEDFDHYVGMYDWNKLMSREEYSGSGQSNGPEPEEILPALRPFHDELHIYRGKTVGTIWYKPLAMHREGSQHRARAFYAYLGSNEEGRYWVRLKITSNRNKEGYIDTLVVRIDGKLEIVKLDRNKDVLSISGKHNVDIAAQQPLIRKIARSRDVQVALAGPSERTEWKLTDEDLEGLRLIVRCLDALAEVDGKK